MAVAISLHSKVNAGLLTSGVMSLYLVFLCWSAIMSKPFTETCNTRERQTGKADWLTVISFLIAFLAIAFATYTTGIDSKSFSFKKRDEVQEDEKLPYSYGFFHFVFAMGAMYFAMLFVGRNLHQTMHKWSIDVGWTSTWVKIVNHWLAAALYICGTIKSVKAQQQRCKCCDRLVYVRITYSNNLAQLDITSPY
ncbi:hypothetical protein M758_UG138000 [Ceratodon purpureus]|nr:hypothetical protein M758_UG138000 [Ceratodon purpureus]